MELSFLQMIVTCLFAIVCLSVLLYIIELIYQTKFGIRQVAIFLIATGASTSVLSNLLLDFGIYNLKAVLEIPLVILFMCIFLKLNLVRSVLFTGLYTILLALSSAVANVVFSIFGYNLDVETGNVYNDLRNKIFAYIIMVVFHVCIAVLANSFKPYIVFSKEVKSKAYKKVIANLFFALIMVIANFSYFDMGYASEKPYVFLNLFLIICYFLFTIYNINTSFQLESKRQELEYQVFYNKTLESIMDDLRRFKHNYNNMLAVINGYVMIKRWDELKNYMKEIISQENKENVFNSVMLLKIKNAGLFGLMTDKIQYAGKKGVEIKILIEDEINEVSIKVSELCEIMGILLDNAIEAAAESEEKYVKVVVQKVDGSISFNIENSVNKLPDLQKIYERSYSTKGTERGMGLWILNNIIKKNNNIMLNTISKGNRFRQDLIVS